MTTTGLESFDRTVQETNPWLKDVMRHTGPDRQRAVLVALGRRITRGAFDEVIRALPAGVRELSDGAA